MSQIILSMRYKKQSNSGSGVKKDIDESLKNLKAYGYVLSSTQLHYINSTAELKGFISDPVKKRRAQGIVSNVTATGKYTKFGERYILDFSSLKEIPYTPENFSVHRRGVKLYDSTGNEIK